MGQHVLHIARYIAQCMSLGLLASLLSQMRLQADGDQAAVSVSFESPFTQTRLKETVDTCMRLWGDLQALCSGTMSSGSEHDQQLMLDMAIGRAAFVSHSISLIAREHADRSISSEGLPYIGYVMGQISQLCDQAPQEITQADRFACLRSLLEETKRKCTVGCLLQTNNATISTSE